eukprot:491095_1
MAAERTEEKQNEYHKKKSQPPNTIAIQKYQMSTLRENEESAIISSISNSIRSSGHILLDKPTSLATRNYYERIVNDVRTTYDEKKFKIYIDLVMGSKTALKLGNDRNKLLKHKLVNDKEISLNYKIGTQTEDIYTQRGCVITVGRYKQTDICLGNKDLTISRIQCFILIIENNIIILDGWSYFGTKTIQINGNKNNLQNSMPNKRFLLRFNRDDSIHLRFGESNTDLIINPKLCIICMDKSRTIRNKCGHLILCSMCYNNILSSIKSLCPICRAPISIGLNCNENDDVIKSYCKPLLDLLQ